MFNAQVINRVAWDGTILPPDANELGWKDTVRMNPLQDAIIALQPSVAQLPFPIPESNRPLDPTMPVGALIWVTDPLTGLPAQVPNAMTNFGWEYVWHCHMLGHEEMDFMRPMKVAGVTAADYVKSCPAPYNVTALVVNASQVNLNWQCNCPAGSSHRVERATEYGNFATIATLADVTSYPDTTVTSPGIYRYRIFSFTPTTDSLPSDTVRISMAIPFAPYALAATSDPLSSNPPVVRLVWDNDAINETGSHLQRSTSKTFPPATTITFNLPPNSSAYNDTAVAKHATYYYRVSNYNGIGESAYSNIAIAATPGQLPLPPTALTVAGTTQTTVSLSWIPAANSKSTLVQRSTVSASGPWVTLAYADSSYKNAGLKKNTTYWYSLKAYNSDGYSTATAAVTAVTQP